MSLDEGIALMKKGFKEINERFLVGGATFTLKVSDCTRVRRVAVSSDVMEFCSCDCVTDQRCD